ncbi:MAG: hypothetical protein FWE01_03135 [Firmicutes bacterium]|nr:hypothetical protein [Bacillota bacterium]
MSNNIAQQKFTTFNSQLFTQRKSGLWVPTKVITSSSAVGKTYIAQKYDGIVDLSARRFMESDFNEAHSATDYERTKMINYSNPSYPYNYIDAIHEYEKMEDVQLILVAFLIEKLTMPEFSQYVDENLDFLVALPRLSMLDELWKRMELRGNNEEFINLLKEYYPQIIENFGHSGMVVEDGEYLEDSFRRHGLLNDNSLNI